MMLALVLIGYAHMWLNGRNTFVKVCVYQDGIHQRRYAIDPDAPCPTTITKPTEKRPLN